MKALYLFQNTSWHLSIYRIGQDANVKWIPHQPGYIKLFIYMCLSSDVWTVLYFTGKWGDNGKMGRQWGDSYNTWRSKQVGDISISEAWGQESGIFVYAFSTLMLSK